MHKTKFAHSLVAAAALAAFLAAAPAQAEIKEKFISQPPAVQTGRLDGRVSAVPAAPDGRRGDRISAQPISPDQRVSLTGSKPSVPTSWQAMLIWLGLDGLVLSE